MSEIKKILLVFLIILSIVSVPLTSLANQDITLVVNGQKVETDVSPVIKNNRTMVPVRALFTAFGAVVTWNDLFRQVVLTSGDLAIILTVGSDVAYVNGYSQKLDVAPVIVEDRTMVPIRFISETLGYTVKWEQAQKTVYIYDVPPESDNTPDSTPADKSESSVIELKSVSTDTHSNYAKVTVNLSNNVTPKVMTLQSPDRIVLDFYGVTQVCPDSKKLYDSYQISAIRWAKHEKYTRLVVESTSKLTYEIGADGTNCVLTVHLSNSTSSKPDNNPNAPIVVIDAGHGGADCGAVGRDANGNVVIYEAHVNLDIALRVQQGLISKGVNVIMTRTTDVSLADSAMSDLVKRADIANKANADLFISVHNNSFSNPEATGTTVLYAGLANSGSYGITSYEVAEIMQKHLVQATGLKDRGLTRSPGIVVLKRTDMPAVLLECAFVSSYNDQKVLTDSDKLNDIADAVCDGIIESLKKMGKYS